MPDILDDLRDLHEQATTDRSHYYTAGCVRRAIAEIERLQARCEVYKAQVWAGANEIKRLKALLDSAVKQGAQERSC
jgi:hypothetical protein